MHPITSHIIAAARMAELRRDADLARLVARRGERRRFPSFRTRLGSRLMAIGEAMQAPAGGRAAELRR